MLKRDIGTRNRDSGTPRARVMKNGTLSRDKTCPAGQDDRDIGTPGLKAGRPAFPVCAEGVRKVQIEPWPVYRDNGTGGPIWRVNVAAPEFRGALAFSSRLGRFHRTAELVRLKRVSPSLYTEAFAAAVRAVGSPANQFAADPRFAAWVASARAPEGGQP